MKRSSNHTGLINLVYSEKRELRASLDALSKQIEHLDEQRRQLAHELNLFPCDEDIDGLTHQELVDAVGEGSRVDIEIPEHLLDDDVPACPCCSAAGKATDEDAQVLRCTACSGIFTDPRQPITPAQALKFVALGSRMSTMRSHSRRTAFYFDLDIVKAEDIGGELEENPMGQIRELNAVSRLHGWAMRDTKLVAQWG